MPNFKVTEYDTVVSTYKVKDVANKQMAINKIANGDIVTRATYRARGYKKGMVRVKYRAREIINGKEKKIQVIAEETQNKENTTSTLLRTPTRTRANEVYKIL